MCNERSMILCLVPRDPLLYKKREGVRMCEVSGAKRSEVLASGPLIGYSWVLYLAVTYRSNLWARYD